MGLLNTILNSANALQVYDKGFATIQANIANANTPGYADQNLTLIADSFDPSANVYGGVAAGPIQSSRDEYLEQSVRAQTNMLGSAQQQASDLVPLSSIFDLTSATGISGTLNKFFNAFSQLSVTPNDTVARQNVLTQSQALATSFNQAAIAIHTAGSNIIQETKNSISTINRIASDLQTINQHYATTANGSSDAGLDAQVNTDLENLSQVANFSVLRTNGQINVYLGGQTPLVLGSQAFAISGDFSTPQTVINDANGNDITSQITTGQLGAQIQESNTMLPGYLTSLNTQAQNLADTVNNTLAQGVDANGSAPTQNLFTYDPTAGPAYTLAVTQGFTTSQIAAALPSAPGGNGNALAVANLATAIDANGFTFTQVFGNLGQQVGTDLSTAQQNQSEQQSLVTQAQANRAAVSGVNVNAEAAKLLQYQQAYGAVSKMVTVLNQLTQDVINMIQ